MEVALRNRLVYIVCCLEYYILDDIYYKNPAFFLEENCGNNNKFRLSNSLKYGKYADDEISVWGQK